MAKLPASMRKKLQHQKEEEEKRRGGKFFSWKNFTKGRFRLLPSNLNEDAEDADSLIGRQVLQLYAPAIKKYVTSPRTYGYACPVMDVMDNVRAHGTDEEKEAVKGIRILREVVCKLVNKTEKNNPFVQLVPLKSSIYDAIRAYMIGDMDDDGDNDYLEDDGEDITNLEEGRDFLIRKSGEKLDTEYTVKFYDQSPVHEDEQVAEALMEQDAAIDLDSAMRKVNLEHLNALYQLLTGEDVPDEYTDTYPPEILTTEDDAEQDDDDAPAKRPGKKLGKKASGAKAKVKAKAEPEEPEEPEEEEVEEVVELKVGMSVSFTDDDDNEHVGTIVKIKGDAAMVDVDDQQYEVPVELLSVAEEAEEEEEPEEPEEPEEEEEEEPEEAEEEEEEEEEEPEEPARPAAPRIARPKTTGKTAGKTVKPKVKTATKSAVKPKVKTATKPAAKPTVKPKTVKKPAKKKAGAAAKRVSGSTSRKKTGGKAPASAKLRKKMGGRKS